MENRNYMLPSDEKLKLINKWLKYIPENWLYENNIVKLNNYLKVIRYNMEISDIIEAYFNNKNNVELKFKIIEIGSINLENIINFKINDVEKAVIKSKIDLIDNKEKEIEKIKNISLLNRSMLDEYLLFKLEKEGLEKKLVK